MVSRKFQVIGLCTCQISKLNEGLVLTCKIKIETKFDPLHNNMRSKFGLYCWYVLFVMCIKVSMLLFAIWQIIFKMENITTFSTIRLSYLFVKSCMTKFAVFFKDLICLFSQSISICIMKV